MKLQNMIITGIAFMAIIVLCCGTINAQPIERTVLGAEWGIDLASPAPIHKYIAGELTPEQIEELLKEAGENQSIGSTEKIIVDNVNPKDIDIRPKGIGYYEDQGIEYKDTIKPSTGGIEVTDWINNEVTLEKEMNHIIKCDLTPSISEHTYSKGTLTIPIDNVLKIK